MTTALAGAIMNWVDVELARASSLPVLMLSGAQGIGKSSAMAALTARSDIRIVVLGLDDFYLTHKQRRMLADGVHPLCETRGPPGTHDLALLGGTLDALAHGPASRLVSIPRFDKRTDDRVPTAHWQTVAAQPDAILLEGWLTGALSDPQAALSAPINALEADDDPEGVWRGWQEDALASEYAGFWDLADAFVHLRAPGFEIVPVWRCQQEEVTLGLEPGTLPDARRAWVYRFVQHYERVTRRMLSGGARSGSVMCLDEQRSLIRLG